MSLIAHTPVARLRIDDLDLRHEALVDRGDTVQSDLQGGQGRVPAPQDLVLLAQQWLARVRAGRRRRPAEVADDVVAEHFAEEFPVLGVDRAEIAGLEFPDVFDGLKCLEGFHDPFLSSRRVRTGTDGIGGSSDVHRVVRQNRTGRPSARVRD
jgi:hypothetical protein